MKLSLAVFFLMILSQGISLPDTLHVPGDETTIQSAIDVAENGDTVLVAPGVYLENIRFHGKAITVISEEGPAITGIIGFSPQNPEYGSVVTFRDNEGSDSILEGFTLMGGKGTDGQAWDLEGDCGGGVLCADQSSPTLKNNVIFMNRICGTGAGLCILNSSPAVLDCLFVENTIHNGSDFCWGAAVYIQGPCTPSLSGCTFDGNMIHDFSYPACGAGIYTRNASLKLMDCCFYDNRIDADVIGTTKPTGGGGIFIEGGDVELVRCWFEKNECTKECGGAIYNLAGELQIEACMFIENKTTAVSFYERYGGAIFNVAGSLIIANCIFSGNQACPGEYTESYGGALYSLQGQVAMDHCSFSTNSAESGGAIGLDDSPLTAANCIFWNNIPNEIDNETGTPAADIAYSCVMNGHAGAGNIDADPQFKAAAAHDLHLLYTSPCRDMGNDSVMPAPNDFEGDPRKAGSHTDMGADEFHTHLYCMGDFTPGSPIDANFVGLPGTSPLGLFLSAQLLDPPLSLVWGDFYLGAPWLLVMLPSIPTTGILTVSDTIPETPATAYFLYLQALVGTKLSNIYPLNISPN